MKDSFEVKSKENGLSASVGKESYPLHKQISESKSMETKYGENGICKGSKMSKKY